MSPPNHRSPRKAEFSLVAGRRSQGFWKLGNECEALVEMKGPSAKGPESDL